LLPNQKKSVSVQGGKEVRRRERRKRKERNERKTWKGGSGRREGAKREEGLTREAKSGKRDVRFQNFFDNAGGSRLDTVH
jgi:hypothetical protein